MVTFGVGILDADTVQGDQLSAFLLAQGLAVESFRDAAALLAVLAERSPQVLLLGAGPEPSATLTLLRRIRERSRLPVVIIGMADGISQVAALEAGADDVVPRSLPPRALLARIRSLLRRAEWGPAVSEAGLNVNGWRLLAERRQLLRPDGSECPLTTAEFDLLRLLLEAGGRPVSRDTVAKHVLRRPFRAEDRTVDNLVLRLRRKLGPRQQDSIKTVRGAGYMFAGFAEEELRVA